MSIFDNFRRHAETQAAAFPNGDVELTPIVDPYSSMLPYGPRFQFLQNLKVSTTHLIGIADVRFTHDQCDGHFRDMPVVPGVFMVEALAQLCAATAQFIIQEDGLRFFFKGGDGIDCGKQIAPEAPLRAIILWKRGEKLTVKQYFVAALYNESDELVCSGIIKGFAMRGRNYARF